MRFLLFCSFAAKPWPSPVHTHLPSEILPDHHPKDLENSEHQPAIPHSDTRIAGPNNDFPTDANSCSSTAAPLVSPDDDNRVDNAPGRLHSDGHAVLHPRRLLTAGRIQIDPASIRHLIPSSPQPTSNMRRQRDSGTAGQQSAYLPNPLVALLRRSDLTLCSSPTKHRPLVMHVQCRHTPDKQDLLHQAPPCTEYTTLPSSPVRPKDFRPSTSVPPMQHSRCHSTVHFSVQSSGSRHASSQGCPAFRSASIVLVTFVAACYPPPVFWTVQIPQRLYPKPHLNIIADTC